jgi:hypothetical protein
MLWRFLSRLVKLYSVEITNGAKTCMHKKLDDLGRFSEPSLLILASLASGPRHG